MTLGHEIADALVGGAISANEPGLLTSLVTAGAGLAILPWFRVRPDVESGALRLVLTGMDLPAIPISVVYPGKAGADTRLARFAAFLKETVPPRLA